MTDIVENTQAETVVTSKREPTFGETLQSAASFCESLKRQGSADEWDFDYLIGKFRDAAFAVSLWDKAREGVLAEIASQARRIEELERGERLETYYSRQIEWSRETFGPALRTKGVLDHIRKECAEVEANPHDLSEWVDLIILAMDGFWRHGGKADDLMPALLAKQRKNMARTWPDWRTMSEDRAIEHDRSADARAFLNRGEG